MTRKIITAREQCELLQPWLNRTADISGNHNLSLVDFFQWCANEHLRPNRAALEAYSQQSGISVEDFLNISSMLDDMGLDGHYLEILRDASRRFWAMASAEDAYDQKPNKDQRAQVGMPLQQNTSGKWYHVSPHKMEPDTILTPGGGISPYNYNNADMPTQRQKDWVWMDGPSAVRQWYYATLLGQIHQGKENPWAYIYEVEPSEGPHPWNGSGHDGHVAPSARIVREIATDKYNRLPDHLGAQRFWAMADTTKWHPLIKHEPRGKSGIYHITIPDKFSTTGKRLGDISYTRGLKGELQCVWEEDGNFGWKPRKHNESYIDSLIVHPDYQGQGIAQALIERLHKDFPDHKINPGATTPEGHGFTQRILETAPNASDTIAPNYKPHILDDDDVQAFNTNELERLVNAAKIIVGKFFRTSMPAPKNLSFRQHPDYPGGRAAQALDGDKEIGRLSWDGKDTVEWITTHPEYRGHGVARQLFDWSKQNLVPGLQHSTQLTPSGEGFARSFGYQPPKGYVKQPPVDDSEDWPDAETGQGEKWQGPKWKSEWYKNRAMEMSVEGPHDHMQGLKELLDNPAPDTNIRYVKKLIQENQERLKKVLEDPKAQEYYKKFLRSLG